MLFDDGADRIGSDRLEQQGCCFKPARVLCKTLTTKNSENIKTFITESKGLQNKPAPAPEV